MEYLQDFFKKVTIHKQYNLKHYKTGRELTSTSSMKILAAINNINAVDKGNMVFVCTDVTEYTRERMAEWQDPDGPVNSWQM